MKPSQHQSRGKGNRGSRSLSPPPAAPPSPLPPPRPVHPLPQSRPFALILLHVSLLLFLNHIHSRPHPAPCALIMMLSRSYLTLMTHSSHHTSHIPLTQTSHSSPFDVTSIANNSTLKLSASFMRSILSRHLSTILKKVSITIGQLPVSCAYDFNFSCSNSHDSACALTIPTLSVLCMPPSALAPQLSITFLVIAPKHDPLTSPIL